MERIICCKANYLADVLGYDVTIITTDRGSKPNFYTFSDKVKFIDLNINYYELGRLSFTKRICRQIKKRRKHSAKLTEMLHKLRPDIVVSTHTHEFTLLPDIRDGSIKIGEIHFSKEYNEIENRYRKQSALSRRFSIAAEKRKYRFIDKYDKFVVLTQRDRLNWENHANVAQIYNLLSLYPAKTAPLKARRMISVGRLVLQKGYDMLIEAFRVVYQEYPDWQLDIFGEGADREELLQLIEDYQLTQVVKINPPTNDIQQEYLNSSLYVMSSRYEGFGMVLAEAMACGVPCISFDCPYGPSEIITDGEDGFLAENGNVQGLADKIKILISDADLRKQMGTKAKENVKRFSADIIMAQWDELFQKLLREK
jgi:glycosyltransferase involved in cell wall biosynthesis